MSNNKSKNKWFYISLCCILLLAPFQSIHAECQAVYPTAYIPGPWTDCTKLRKRNFGLCGTMGPVFFGVSAHQGIQPNTIGYNIGMGGAGFLVETDLWRFLKLGLAFSGYIMQVNPGSDVTETTPKIRILSGTPAVYGGINYAGGFLYLTAATGILKYSTSRTITVANRIATARYEARQNSFRARIGYALPLGTLEITPIAVLDNVNLRRGAYVETGAGAFNLTVKNGEVSGSQLSVGARFAEVSEPDIFYPEIHFFSFSDANTGAKLKVISRFLDGIPPIVLEGNTPGSNGYNVGGSIATTIFGYGMYVIAAYDYEVRQKSFNSHSFFVRVMATF